MLNVLPELGLVILHTLVIYLFLIVALSLLGHRQTAELNLTELVVIMVIGSSVETSMVAGDTSLLAGLTSATTLLVGNRALSVLMERWGWLRRVVVGHPTLLFYKGHFLSERVRGAGLTEDDVREGIRERGYDNLDQVRLAVLEVDGTISVVPR
jgi:uncharacterized membrane protein YcaP (DUF421 family)